MPQKKNPDVFELTRGKAGTLIGMLTGLLATLKGLPSTYDKDLQEDKAPVFAAADTLLAILPVMAGAINTITAKPQRMRNAQTAQGNDPALLRFNPVKRAVLGCFRHRENPDGIGLQQNFWCDRRH